MRACYFTQYITVLRTQQKKIKVLKFWVSERARVISHFKLTVYVLNFEYAKPGTLRDKVYLW